LTDLPFPAAEIGTQDRFLLIVGNLYADEAFASPTQDEFAFTGDAEVPHPLCTTSGRNEVPASVEGKEVDRGSARLARLTAANLENARAPDADPEAGECGDQTIEDVARKPVRSDVTSRHQAAIISACSSRPTNAARFANTGVIRHILTRLRRVHATN
jgi:hypothetical protein